MRFLRVLFVAFLLPALPLAAAVPAQDTPTTAGRLAFQAATIVHSTVPGKLGTQRRLAGGRYTVSNMTLRALIRLAYGNATLFRPEQQIVGGPDWIDSERFDIEAQAASEFVPDPDGVTRQHLVMLRTLLEARFNLQARMERRDLPVYALVFASADGQFGPWLARSTRDCRPGAPPAPDGVKCGISGDGPGTGLKFRGMPMAGLIGWLNVSPAVDRLVRDETGLSGEFDYELKFVPPLVLGPTGTSPNPAVGSGPTVYTALREQLGLKLDPRLGPVDVLIIDRVEQLNGVK